MEGEEKREGVMGMKTKNSVPGVASFWFSVCATLVLLNSILLLGFTNIVPRPALCLIGLLASILAVVLGIIGILRKECKRTMAIWGAAIGCLWSSLFILVLVVMLILFVSIIEGQDTDDDTSVTTCGITHQYDIDKA